MTEIWKSIPGYEGLYEVSDAGNVRRLARTTKLSTRDVEAILRALQRGVTCWALAPHFGVSAAALSTLTKPRRYSQRQVHLLKPHQGNRGYACVSLCKNGVQKTPPIHQLVTAAFLGPVPHGWYCNHKNGIKTDNRLTNLEYVTPATNTLHAFHVIHTQRSKLHIADIPRIRQMRAQGMTLKAIGNTFGVTKHTIWSALKGKNWAHVAS